MNILLLTLVLLAAWYVIFLIVKSRRAKPFPCAYCLATIATWTVGLMLSALGWVHAPLVLAVLMGQSSLGFFSKLKERAPETMAVIQLPYFFTAIVLTLVILSGWHADFVQPIVLTVVAWTVALLMLTYRTRPRMRRLVERIAACCKNI